MSESMAQGVVLTLADKQKLEAELNELKTVKKAEVTRDIAEARAHGDLSENAEYDEAKNEQARIEGEITMLEAKLRNAVVVDDSDLDNSIINVGNKVKVLDVEFDEEEEFMIVGSAEADVNENKISNESPVGKTLLGKKVGDVIPVETPGGTVNYKVLEISK